jgi:hypothetical protein
MYKYILLLMLAGAFLITSCNKDLDKYPETQLSTLDFWKTPNDLRDACNFFYSFLPAITENFKGNMTDDAYGLNPNNISDGSRLPVASDGEWNNYYLLIRNANNLLENSVKVTGDAPIINRYRAEAKFFRAYAYFELLKRYGDVPLVMKTFGVFDELTSAPRTKREIVIDSIYMDLDYAETYLPLPTALPAAEYGRITSTAALALKARAALFEGTRSKFHNYGTPNTHFQVAINAADKIIISKQHSLYSFTTDVKNSYYHLFQYVAEGPANKENILSRLYGQDRTNLIAAHNFMRLIATGSTTPTRALADAYLYTDGLPLEKSSLARPQTTTLTQFTNRDPRMAMTIMNKNYPFTATGLYKPNFSGTVTGYHFRKYLVGSDFVYTGQSTLDNIIIRYAEVLLTYAEAKFELDGAISDADLEKSFNLVRVRAQMPKLTNAFVNTHQLNLREEIRRERRVELTLENDLRYWDIIRWKIAEDVLPKVVLGIKYFRSEYTTNDNPILDQDGFVIVQTAEKRFFNPTRDYLYPLPSRDLGLNHNLTQNPNWY